MGIYYNTRTVRDGLVLHLDAVNVKSYFGYWSPSLSNGANAFDGNLSTAAGLLGGTTGPFTYTFAKPPRVTSARMHVSLGATSGQVGATTDIILVNGVDVTQKAKNANLYSSSPPGWIDVTEEAGNNWNNFQFKSIAGVTNPGIFAIEINGKILIGDYDGTTWTDLNGNGNNGTLQNGVGYSSSNGGSLSFDGVNDYIQVPLTGSFPQMTFDYWGFFDDPSLNTKSRNESAFGDWNSNRIHWGTRWSVGMHWNVNGDWIETPATNLKYGWNHFSLIWNHTTGQRLIYINNILSTSWTTNGNITLGDFKIGVATNLNAYYRGNISNFKIYTRALSASEIQQNFEAMRGRYGI